MRLKKLHKCCECGEKAVWYDMCDDNETHYYCDKCKPTSESCKKTLIKDNDGFPISENEKVRYISYKEVSDAVYDAKLDIARKDQFEIKDILDTIFIKNREMTHIIEYNTLMSRFGKAMELRCFENNFYSENESIRKFYTRLKNALRKKRFMID